ncbi:hypothetical protein EBZ80_13955 [bacterium]|nr:hypothetical protein [bacterium]
MNHNKRCGARASANVWSKQELVAQAEARHPDRPASFYRGLTKEQLCAMLGLPWPPAPANPVVTEARTCTSHKSRQYPNRYTRAELVALIRQRMPHYSRGTLQKLKVDRLCGLLGLPFVNLRREAGADQAAAAGGAEERAPPNLQVMQQRQVEPEAVDDPTSCVARGAKRLKAHQRRVVDLLERQRGLIAVHALGSGKTLSALVVSQCYLDRHPTHKVVVLTPASLVSNFRKEMAEFGPTLRHEDRYVVESYQKFMHDAKRHPGLTALCRRTLLVIDEGHNLRTIPSGTFPREKGVMTKFVLQCAERASRVLVLTGTPVVNDPMDMMTLLNMVRDDPTDANRLTKALWREQYGTPAFWNTYVRGKVDFYSPSDASRLLHYPETTVHTIYLEMTPHYRARYEDVEDAILSEHNITVFGESQLKPFFNGIRRAVNTLDTDPAEMQHSPKLQWVKNFLEERTARRPPTVVFSHFLDMGSLALFRRLPVAWRESAAFITGDTPKGQRQRIVDRFNQGEVRLLFLSKAGGEGLDLKGVRNVIILEPSWNTATEEQVIGRAVRFDSHAHLPEAQRHVSVYRLVLIKPEDRPLIARIRDNPEEVAFEPDTLPSADLLLHLFQERKRRRLEAFLNALRAHRA